MCLCKHNIMWKYCEEEHTRNIYYGKDSEYLQTYVLIKQGRMKRHKAATVFIWDIWKKNILKKNFEKKLKKKSKVENQNISYGRASKYFIR